MTSQFTAKALLACCSALAAISGAWAQARPATAIVVTLLGTGTPDPSIDRFGASTLVQAGGKTLVFDAGRGAAIRLEQSGVKPGKIDALFLTHYHSDHTSGLPDIWLTGWLPRHGGRQLPLKVYGPAGVDALLEGLTRAYKADIDIRLVDELLPAAGARLTAIQFERPGTVYEENGVRVDAFEVFHGEHIHPSYGYKISYRQHSVVLSGDTRKSANVIEAAKGSDLLVHEVAMAGAGVRSLPAVQRIMDHHTSPEECGEVFAASKPKLAVYSHIVLLKDASGVRPTPEQIIAQTRTTYAGPVVVGEDLMRFDIGDTVQIRRYDASQARWTSMN